MNSISNAKVRAGAEERTETLALPYTVAALLLLILGVIEGWYKRTFYTTDAISYLDISRAIPRHEWKLVFNSMWSSGYPFLIAAVRPYFAPGAQGEWSAIHVLNLGILLFTYGTFIYLLRTLEPDLPEADALERTSRRRFLFFVGVCIFFCTELCINGVSRVSPDPLVDGLFFAALATSLRLIRNPGKGLAALLGIILGAGYLAKAFFLPLAAIFLAVTVAALWKNKRALRLAWIPALVFSLIALPYVLALSNVTGRFTWGDSGSLNYAFHVNLLPRWTNWQGGPPGYGHPIHPSRMLSKDPPFFEFGEPFHNTYPPFGHVAYWYQGYRRFWSPKYQAAALLRNTFSLAKIVVQQPAAWSIVGLVLALGILIPPDVKRQWTARTLRCWPLFLPPLLAIVFYAWVHLEDRYVAAFLAVLGLLPFVSLSALQPQISRRLRLSVFAVFTVAVLASFVTANRTAFVRAIHRESYTNDPEWKLGAYLRQIGLKPGDGIGAIGGPNAECTWAYVAGVRIVAEVGGLPYDPHPGPHDRWWANGKGAADSGAQEFWASSPEAQGKILELFRQSGAVVVVAPEKSAGENVPGWQHIPGSTDWIYRF